jgi:ligand-binding SRPBCC domain-containing protein
MGACFVMKGKRMRHSFQTEQWLPYPRERVFAFFADPANLPPLMPGWQRARVEKANHISPPEASSTGKVFAGRGSLLTISFRAVPLIPVRLEWDAYIAEFHWDEYFCDEQRRGPFKYFRHCHRVSDEARDGVMGCVVGDAVEYELPLGMLGDLANGLVVRGQIRALFAHRQRMLPALLAAARA